MFKIQAKGPKVVVLYSPGSTFSLMNYRCVFELKGRNSQMGVVRLNENMLTGVATGVVTLWVVCSSYIVSSLLSESDTKVLADKLVTKYSLSFVQGVVTITRGCNLASTSTWTSDWVQDWLTHMSHRVSSLLQHSTEDWTVHRHFEQPSLFRVQQNSEPINDTSSLFNTTSTLMKETVLVIICVIMDVAVQHGVHVVMLWIIISATAATNKVKTL